MKHHQSTNSTSSKINEMILDVKSEQKINKINLKKKN